MYGWKSEEENVGDFLMFEIIVNSNLFKYGIKEMKYFWRFFGYFVRIILYIWIIKLFMLRM